MNDQKSNHDGVCHPMWCGPGRGFSWMRIVVGIIILFFVFSMGMKVGEFKSFFRINYFSHPMMGYGMMGGYNQFSRGMMNNLCWQNDGVLPAETTVPSNQ